MGVDELIHFRFSFQHLCGLRSSFVFEDGTGSSHSSRNMRHAWEACVVTVELDRKPSSVAMARASSGNSENPAREISRTGVFSMSNDNYERRQCSESRNDVRGKPERKSPRFLESGKHSREVFGKNLETRQMQMMIFKDLPYRRNRPPIDASCDRKFQT
jgi:hypothetical protein